MAFISIVLGCSVVEICDVPTWTFFLQFQSEPAMGVYSRQKPSSLVSVGSWGMVLQETGAWFGKLGHGSGSWGVVVREAGPWFGKLGRGGWEAGAGHDGWEA